MYFVYVLYSRKHEKTYTGMTTDVNRRLLEHNHGKSFYSAKYRPWQVVHFESFEYRKDAREREKYLKSATGRRWMKSNINWPRSSTG
ncbi:GIY-YIG nuclease family protein [Flagellimonas lutaonensis]|uniref:GIY-YIG nuclease family protein n=1 Tax=Flagellimonas lutaonensis TaxID=516051 RepID=UPI000A048EA2